MAPEVFDVIVIGGGTGGLRTAFHSALRGKKTAMIEPAELGGTCLNRGCIPTKAMLHASHLYSVSQKFHEYGIEISKPHVNFKRLMKRVNNIVEIGQEHISKSVQHKKLTVFRDRGRFLDKDLVVVGTKIIRGKKIILSTGSTPRIPPIKGIENTPYLTSKDVLKLQKLPRSVGIIGGGYIALELATFFNQLGVDVTIIGRASRILPAIDGEITNHLTKHYQNKGVKIELDAEASEIKQKLLKKEITYRKKGGTSAKITVDEIILAVGRAPVTKDLGLEAAKIKVTQRGAVQINQYLETSNPSIYALGDVTGKAMFAHAAKRASEVVLTNILGRKKMKMPFENIPWAVFTQPPIAGIGKNERELREEKIPHGILSTMFSHTGRAEIMDEKEGIAKVYYHKKTQKILGATLYGARADEIIHEFVALIQTKGTIQDLKEMIHIHPTVSEVNGNYHWPK